MHRFVLAFAAWFALAASAAQADQHASDVLAQAKAAAGGAAWDSVHFIRTKSEVQTSGLTGPTETIEDVRTGVSVNTYQLGPMKGANGYDGKSVWSQDNSGQVAVDGGDDARLGSISDAYRVRRGYWKPGDAAEIVYSGAKADNGRSFDIVRITPKGGRAFDLWLDSRTHLIDRLVEKSAIDTTTTFFSDYRAVAGKMLPFAVHSTNGETKYDTIIKVQNVTFEDSVPLQAFAPPPPPPRDFGFLGGQKFATMPFKLINNHMYVEVKLNGHGPYELLFDTGGSNVITPTVARELGLKLQGALQGRGAGEKSEDVALTMVDHMEIGGAFMDRQAFASTAFESFGDVEGKTITGIFGYEVFKRFVVRTDYQANTVTLYEPNGFTYQGPGSRVPFVLKGTIPSVQGDIDGIAGTFDLDTGSRASLDLMAPFVAKNNLVARYGATVHGVDGWGFGGAAHAWIVRGHRLTFGGISVDAPVVGLSEARQGAFADSYAAGNIGAGVLKRFNIVWDYGHSVMFFERNAHYAEPDVFNRAGVWANLASGAGFEVIDVYAGSPAAEAGLKVGDHIMAVDGKAAQRELSLPDFRLRMKEAVGTKLTLDVVRGGQKLQIVVTLRDLV